MFFEFKILIIVLIGIYSIYKNFITFVNEVRYFYFVRIFMYDDNYWENRVNRIKLVILG